MISQGVKLTRLSFSTQDAWVRYAAETSKIREVLLVLDCLNQMGNTEARNDFLNGTNGAVKLTEDDLKILDDL